MQPQADTGVTARPISAAELQAIKESLGAQVVALVAVAYTTQTGTLIAEVGQDMTFLGARVVPDGAGGGHAPGAPALAYRVQVGRIVAWRPWGPREIEAAVAALESAAIVW